MSIENGGTDKPQNQGGQDRIKGFVIEPTVHERSCFPVNPELSRKIVTTMTAGR